MEIESLEGAEAQGDVRDLVPQELNNGHSELEKYEDFQNIQDFRKESQSTYIEESNGPYVAFLDAHKVKVLLAGLIVILGLGYYALTVFADLAPNGFTDPSSDSTYTNQLFSDRYVSPSPDIFAVISYPPYKPSDQQFKDAYFSMKASLQKKITDAYAFASYFEYPQYPGSISTDGYKAITSFRLPDATKYTLSDYQNSISGTSLTVHFGGSELSNQEIPAQLTKDLAAIEMGSVPVLVVLLVRFYKYLTRKLNIRDNFITKI